ncbi:uncharacterized protein LOC132868975 [Neoarius graeffei]|uniref:uncharacterized protein LOC132868975 n=1 Tax=Neoarius graeffei TaxID=443677 RepID=UPI00298CBB7E|nr:uncharacterized protein LOC132868975 [Neoarius graeffei]
MHLNPKLDVSSGCVLSPLLFILYTDECRSTYPNCHLVKFADDTVLLSLLSGPSLHHGPALQQFIEWCDSSCLELNVSKTKEMVVTFSSSQRELAAAVTTMVHGFPVETVEEYKYLGTILDCQLRFSSNTEGILRKCHQRMYLLRKLNSFSVSQNILLTFYYTFIESVLACSICCWYYSITVQDRNRLHNIVKVCSKIIGLPARHLNTVYEQQASGLARRILKDSTHALFPAFEQLPSGHRFRCLACKTQRRRATFVPSVILLLNSKKSKTVTII